MPGIAGGRGVYAASDSSAPDYEGVAWTAQTPEKRAEANGLVFNAWRSSGTYAGHSFYFDKRGVYEFAAGVLSVPAQRWLIGTPEGVTLRAVTAGVPGSTSWLVRTQGGSAHVQNIVLDANNLCEYALRCESTTFFHGWVWLRNATVAGIYAYNTVVLNEGLLMSWDSPVLFHFEYCSESIFGILSGARPGECGLRVKGTAAGGGLNGGRFSLHDIVVGSSTPFQYGIDLDNISDLWIGSASIEGGTVPLRIRNQTRSVDIGHFRCNAGNIEIDNSHSVRIRGGVSSSSRVIHTNGGRGNHINVSVETQTGFVAAPQDWYNGDASEGSPWIGQYNARGELLSTNNTRPNKGRWEQGDRVFPRVPVTGTPSGWHCSVGGNYGGTPPTWVALANFGAIV